MNICTDHGPIPYIDSNNSSNSWYEKLLSLYARFVSENIFEISFIDIDLLVDKPNVLISLILKSMNCSGVK